MRKNTKSIMWALLVTFVLWGGSSAVFSRSRASSYAGSIAGKKVRWKEYDRSLLAVENQARLIYGEKYHQIKQYLNTEEEAWNRLLLLKEAEKTRLNVSDNEAIETVCNMPIFQDANGKFSNPAYQRVMEYFLKIPAREFEEEIKESLKIKKLMDLVTKDVTILEKYVLEEYKARNEKANADFILLAAEDFEKDVTADDKMIDAYYQLHKEDFREPLSVNIEYIAFEYAEDKKDPAVSEQKARQKADEISSDVSYELSEAKEPSLSEAAKKFGLTLKETGFFAMNEPIPGIGLSYEIAFEAFKLQEGQISHPIKTAKGRYIIKLKGKKESFLPQLNQIQEKVKKAVLRQQAFLLAQARADELLAQNAQATLEELAKKLKAAVKSTGLFTKTGYIPQVGNSEEFAKKAFGGKAGELAGTAKTPEGIAIIFVTEKTGIDEEKFKKEKDEFKKTLLEEKKSGYFKLYFNNLKQSSNIISVVSPKFHQKIPSPPDSVE